MTLSKVKKFNKICKILFNFKLYNFSVSANSAKFKYPSEVFPEIIYE